MTRCSACGASPLEPRVEAYRVEHDGKAMEIQDSRMVCPGCGVVAYVGEQISRHERAVADAIRTMHGLLTARELEQIRTKYRLRQTDMEQILSTGPKTWTRWERGKVPQSKAADKLIRLIAEDPDIAKRLMLQAGVENPEAEAVFQQIEDSARVIGRALLQAELAGLASPDAMSLTDRLSDKAFDVARIARQQAANQAKAA